MKKIKYFFISMRPHQWTKNVFLLPAVIFSKKVANIPYLLKVLLGILLFCLVSGFVYIVNDIVDYDKDRFHPRKKNRPIAGGKIKRGESFLFGIGIFLVSMIVAFSTSFKFFTVLLMYVVLQILYSFWLKHVVIMDVFCIAFGFVLRIIAGAVIINVEISRWFILCGFLLSLFLAVGKRRAELSNLGKKAASHRTILKKYTIEYLDALLIIVSCSVVITYSLYTLDPITCAKFGNANLSLSIPFVIYGLFRYIYLIKVKNFGDAPEEIVIKDIPLFVNSMIYLILIIIIIYGHVILPFFKYYK